MNINNKNSDTNMGKEKCLYYVAELLKELNHFHNTKLIIPKTNIENSSAEILFRNKEYQRKQWKEI